MTRIECMRGLSARIQNLRERIVASGEECLMAEEENELLRLERKREALISGRDLCVKL
ncbi:MAG: hypothetical protein V1882_05015 [Candidatus Omnitrophota bacterium]